MENKVAHLNCSICSAQWSTAITGLLLLLLAAARYCLLIVFLALGVALSEPIDVYSEWIDACEAANQKDKEQGGGQDEDGGGNRESDEEF